MSFHSQDNIERYFNIGPTWSTLKQRWNNINATWYVCLMCSAIDGPSLQSFRNRKVPADTRVQDVESMLVLCWSNVVDGGPTVNQHWYNILCLLDIIFLDIRHNLHLKTILQRIEAEIKSWNAIFFHMTSMHLLKALIIVDNNTAMSCLKAVAAYLKSEQLVYFVYLWQNTHPMVSERFEQWGEHRRWP